MPTVDLTHSRYTRFEQHATRATITRDSNNYPDVGKVAYDARSHARWDRIVHTCSINTRLQRQSTYQLCSRQTMRTSP
jgi:hypothetical protein